MNISSTNTALILTVDSKDCNNNKRQDETQEFYDYRDYEQESIDCVKAWRKNAGWLKDIEIWIHSPQNDVDAQTVSEYNKLSINFVNEKLDMIESSYGFFNVHYSGQWMEENLPSHIENTIHIDLDMEILREIPLHVFQTDAKVLLGGYFENDAKHQRKPIFDGILSNTGFIVADRQFKFYEKILNEIKSFKVIGREYDIEEYCADKMASESEEIEIVNGYEQGEGYSVSEDLTNVWFWHEHKTEKRDHNLMMQKLKLIKRLRNEFS